MKQNSHGWLQTDKPSLMYLKNIKKFSDSMHKNVKDTLYNTQYDFRKQKSATIQLLLLLYKL